MVVVYLRFVKYIDVFTISFILITFDIKYIYYERNLHFLYL